MRALLIGNDLNSTRRLEDYLAMQGIRVEVTDTDEDGLCLLRLEQFDLVLLSLTAPQTNAGSFVRRMRQARNDTPVLVLSSSLNRQARVDALGAGADDVVDHATDLTELVARMRAIVRRSRGYSDTILRVGNVALNCDRHQVVVGDNAVNLTGKEFAILQLMILRKNTVMSKEVILTQVYGGMDEPEPKIIDVFIHKLRRKLEKAGAPGVIATVWGRGYSIRDLGRQSFVPDIPSIPTPANRVPAGLMPA